MIKKIITIFLLSLACGWLSAQTTAVSALVTDSDGVNWFGGTWKITFVPNSANPNIDVYNINGTLLDKSVLYQNGVMDSGGNIAFSIYQNTAISPANSSWQLTVCPLASSSCGVYNFSTSTSTLDLSSTLTTVIPPPRFHAIAGAFGYIDAEASTQLSIGNQYYDVTSLCPKFYNGTSWGCVGNNSGFPVIVGTTDPVVTCNLLNVGQLYFDRSASKLQLWGCTALTGPTFSWQKTTWQTASMSNTPGITSGLVCVSDGINTNECTWQAPSIPSGAAISVCHGTISLSVAPIAVAGIFHNTATCTGAVVGDNVAVDFQGADPDGITGYDSTLGETLQLAKKISANNILTVEQINPLANSGSITPGALTLVYRVTR